MTPGLKFMHIFREWLDIDFIANIYIYVTQISGLKLYVEGDLSWLFTSAYHHIPSFFVLGSYPIYNACSRGTSYHTDCHPYLYMYNKSAQGRRLWSSLVCKSMCTRRKCWKLSPITPNITFSKRVTVVYTALQKFAITWSTGGMPEYWYPHWNTCCPWKSQTGIILSS